MTETTKPQRPLAAALALYFVFAVLGTLVFTAGEYIDRLLGTGAVFSVIVGTLLVCVCLLIVRRADGGLQRMTEGPYITKYMALIFILPAISLCMSAAAPEQNPSLLGTLGWLLSLLVSVAWEELLLRHGALLLLGRRRLFSAAGAAVTSIVCGACRFSLLLLSAPLSAAVLQAVLSACAALFLLALYLRTKNILAAATAHFLMTFSVQFFPRLSAEPEALGSSWQLTLFYAAVLLAVSVILLIRGARAEPMD